MTDHLKIHQDRNPAGNYVVTTHYDTPQKHRFTTQSLAEAFVRERMQVDKRCEEQFLPCGFAYELGYSEERRVHESVLRDIERLETLMAVKYPDWAQPDFSMVKHGVETSIQNTYDNAKITEAQKHPSV